MNYQGPGRYKHYKGGIYRVLGLARHESDPDKLLVVYESLEISDSVIGDVDFWARPLDDFNEDVKNKPGESWPRFYKLLQDPTGGPVPKEKETDLQKAERLRALAIREGWHDAV